MKFKNSKQRKAVMAKIKKQHFIKEPFGLPRELQPKDKFFKKDEERCVVCGKPSYIVYGGKPVCSRHYKLEVDKTFKQAMNKKGFGHMQDKVDIR